MSPERLQRRSDRLIVVETLSVILLMTGLGIVMRAATMLFSDGASGGAYVFLLFGALLAAPAFPGLVWARRTHQGAAHADAAESLARFGIALPNGVVPTETGVRFVTRAGGRRGSRAMALGLALFGTIAWATGAPWGLIAICAGFAALFGVVAWLYERRAVDLDADSVRFAHSPRHDLAWADLVSVERGTMPQWLARGRPDDIILVAPGTVRAANGTATDHLRIKVAWLQVSPDHALQVLEAFHEHGGLPSPTGGIWVPPAGR